MGRTAELAALNAGLATLAIAAGIRGSSVIATVGAILTLVGAGMALAKAWAFPVLGRSPRLTRRGMSVWDPAARRPVPE
jgi:hypothetical protein